MPQLSESSWIAIIVISASLFTSAVTLIVTLNFQARQSAIARHQWFAEFAIKRRYEIVHNLHAATLNLYSATLVAVTFIKDKSPSSQDKQDKMIESSLALDEANNLASVYLDAHTQELLEDYHTRLSKTYSTAATHDRTYNEEQFRLARSLLDQIGQQLQPILNPPVVQKFITKIEE